MTPRTVLPLCISNVRRLSCGDHAKLLRMSVPGTESAALSIAVNIAWHALRGVCPPAARHCSIASAPAFTISGVIRNVLPYFIMSCLCFVGGVIVSH